MCGICGILQARDAVEAAVVEKMAAVLGHRGPDDAGVHVAPGVGLGHRRLSIIDLSRQGHQPMHTTDGRYSIVYNGELYNYLELKQALLGQGYAFLSNTDTEVILNAYAEYGTACVQYFNGMFAFAIWDAQARRLFAARDRLGIKPFYYVHWGEVFAFASEIKALLTLDGFHPAPNPDGLADYLTFQFCLSDKTLFENIYKLLPGHILEIAPGELPRIRPYWQLDFTLDTEHGEVYFEHRLLRLLEDAVRLRLRADVPVGAHLSGGLDSSTIACQAAGLLTSPLHVFSGGFQEATHYDETRYARLVADHIGAHYHQVFPTVDDFIDLLPHLVYIMDEPAAGPGLFPQYMVSKLAREHVKVVLGGQGGDEIFGGYTRYLVAYLEEVLHGSIEGTQADAEYVATFETLLPNLGQLRGYRPMLQYFWREGLFEAQDARYFRLINRSESIQGYVQQEVLHGRAGYSPYEAYRAVFNADPQCASYINRMIRFDTLTLLPALLHVEDRTSMAVSLESRVPLLDHRIIELMASVPPTIKYKGGQSKYLFRRAIQHIVPEAIFKRSDKMGFPVPLNEWYAQPQLRSFITDTMLSTAARQRGIFQPEALETVLSQAPQYDRGLWGALSLELWFQTFIDA